MGLWQTNGSPNVGQKTRPYNHHHHIVLAARISLTLSRHSSLSFIALGRSSGQQPVSSHSCWMYVRAGRPAFARPCVGIHKSTSLMSSSLLLQQWPACLVRLTWIVFVAVQLVSCGVLLPGLVQDCTNKKERICKIVDFAVPANHRIKQKECEMKGKYIKLARELKKIWNMKVTIIPIVIRDFGTVTKGLLKGLEDLEIGMRVETIQTTALLRMARILRRVLETWEDLLSLKLQLKTISKCWCKNCNE